MHIVANFQYASIVFPLSGRIPQPYTRAVHSAYMHTLMIFQFKCMS